MARFSWKYYERRATCHLISDKGARACYELQLEVSKYKDRKVSQINKFNNVTFVNKST